MQNPALRRVAAKQHRLGEFGSQQGAAIGDLSVKRGTGMNGDFKHFQMQVYDEVKRLFPDDAIEVLVARAPGPGSDEPLSAAVKVVHRRTGISVDCDQYPSQIQNRIVATLKLRIACDERNA